MHVTSRDVMIQRSTIAIALVRACWPHEIDALHDAEIELTCSHELFECNGQSTESLDPVKHFELFLEDMKVPTPDGELASLVDLRVEDLWLVWLEYNANLLRWALNDQEPESECVAATLGRMEVAMMMASPVWRIQ